MLNKDFLKFVSSVVRQFLYERSQLYISVSMLICPLCLHSVLYWFTQTLFALWETHRLASLHTWRRRENISDNSLLPAWVTFSSKMTLHLSSWFVHLWKNLFDRRVAEGCKSDGEDLRSQGESWGGMQTRGWAEYFWNNWELHTWTNLDMKNVVTDGRSPWLVS